MSPARPSVLFLTSDLPYPPSSGMAIRSYQFLAGLAERYDLHLLSFVEGAYQPARNDALEEYCRSVESVSAPRRSLVGRAASVALSSRPDMALRMRSATMTARLAQSLRETDYAVVHVESIEMAPYGLQVLAARHGDRPRVVFDELNAEYTLQRTAFETDRRSPRRWVGALYSWIQWHKLAAYEARLCRRFDRVIAVSDWDRRALWALAPGTDVRIVPNGVDVEHYRCVRGAPGAELGRSSPQIVFTGKMDFRPNVDAVTWFCADILPRLRESVPDVRFTIVGREPLPAVRALAALPGVTVTGWVPDVRPHLAAADMVAVPMRMGGGTRLKVLEAMAMGVPVVATPLGCEGYGLADGEQVAIAESAEAFAVRAAQLLRDADARRALGERGREFVAARYDWSRIVPLLVDAYTT